MLNITTNVRFVVLSEDYIVMNFGSMTIKATSKVSEALPLSVLSAIMLNI